MLVQAQLHPCLSRLRLRCFEIAVDNIANCDENSAFAWYEHYPPEPDSAPPAPSVADGMLLPNELSLSLLFLFHFSLLRKEF